MITKKALLFIALALGVASFGVYASGLVTTAANTETAQTPPAQLTSSGDACCAVEGKTTTQNAMFKPTVQKAALAQSGSSCTAEAKAEATAAGTCPAQTSASTAKLTSLTKPTVQTAAIATASGDACCADKESKTTKTAKTN